KKGFLRAASEATHVLVRIVAPSQPADTVATPRAPLDLALVIDRSGSMSGRPLEAALESAVRIVRGLRADDRVSVVAFDESIEVVQPLTTVTDREELVRRIKAIDSRGSTDLFGGWEEAVKQLAPFTRKDRIARVILLSDGQANHGLTDETAICQHVARAAAAGITTSTVGLGHGFNETLMTGMARAGEGAANFGQTADDLDEAFEEQFAILSNAFLRQVRVEIQGGSDVQARILGDFLEEGRATNRKLGTLPWASSLVAVVELKVGPAARADSLLAVNFSAVTKDGEPVTFGPAILALPELDLAAFSVLPADANVAAAVAEAVIAEKLEQIEELIRSRLIKDAKENLAALAARADLTDWVKQKVAYLQRLLEEDEVMALKEIRYGRRSMTHGAKTMNLADFSETVAH
ncbi:MAG: VWA domain-containing protein, partial [Verrucomicrobia bacterium]|nr:VWA domain-containing protein [Verrucomicrobiota bacterium]